MMNYFWGRLSIVLTLYLIIHFAYLTSNNIDLRPYRLVQLAFNCRMTPFPHSIARYMWMEKLTRCYSISSPFLLLVFYTAPNILINLLPLSHATPNHFSLLITFSLGMWCIVRIFLEVILLLFLPLCLGNKHGFNSARRKT